MNAIIEFFKTNFTKEVAVFLLSMIPIVELRGAIPVALSLDLDYKSSFLISFIGSSIPAILIVYLIGYVFILLRKINFFDRLIDKITKKALLKRDKIDKYGYWGLFLFVAIPLPGTGVWTGSLISHLLNMNKIKSIITVIIGNLTAGIIVSIISGGIMYLF
ncbi:MAG: small multi-drug export protein [Tissierellia bacterium]|nr:small multi-drug export protein [Tissierellia bacterium]